MSALPKPGECLIRHEPPDLLLIDYIGHIVEAHVRDGEVRCWPFVRDKKYALSIVDISRLESVGPDARRALARPEKHFPMRGVAIVGATFHIRAIVSLVVRAVALLQRQVDNPVRFFSTHDDARRWIEMRRQELHAEGGVT